MRVALGFATLMGVITVVLVEHPPTLLRALRENLSAEVGLNIIGAATSLDRGVNLAARLKPDVVVLDAEIADLDASRAIGVLRERAPTSALIVLTLEPDRFQRIEGTLSVGKIDGANALLAAIRDVARRTSG
jgi:DNA-binding NarL/FixJ family response regulator